MSRTKKTILDELNKERSELYTMRNPKMDKRFTADYIAKIKEQAKFVDELEKEYIAAVSCIECTHLKELFKHPRNKVVGKGSIIDRMGWVCMHPEISGGVFFEDQYGYCEMFEQK